MKISFITLFPEMLALTLNTSILGRAQKKRLVEFELINLRDFGDGPHQIVDDRPYGGGAGMVLKADILTKALTSITGYANAHVLLTSAGGYVFNQKKAREYSKLKHLIIICGHYEGVDQRFIEKYVDEEITIGDYVLTGGELPSLVIADSITRLIPKVLDKEEATLQESFENNLLEYPHYTRPEEFEGLKVPEVLLSGHHKNIDQWRNQQSLKKTGKLRPELLKQGG
jgi:tRNA (guanine37-N1)-methyltransferase